MAVQILYKKYRYKWRIALETTLATNIQREYLKCGYNFQAQLVWAVLRVLM